MPLDFLKRKTPGETTATNAPAPPTASVSPPEEVIAAVERIAQTAQIDVGGIEYIIDDRDGSLLYYDINALSNFVADATRVVGFDPHARLVDFLEQEASKCATVTGYRFSAVG